MAPLGTGLGLEGAALGGPLLGLPDAAEMIKPIKLEQTKQTNKRKTEWTRTWRERASWNVGAHSAAR